VFSCESISRALTDKIARITKSNGIFEYDERLVLRGALTRIIAFAIACLLGYAALLCVHGAFAAHLALDPSRESAEQAVRDEPTNPEFYVRLAHAFPAGAIPAMRRAVTLNPLNSDLWMEFADIAEQQNDPLLAEQCLLKAIGLDRTFAPRWALEEFYYRRKDATRFWPAMRAALATSYDDVTILFDDCWAMAPDPRTILSAAVPHRPDVQSQYLKYLLGKNRLDLAMPVADLVLPVATHETVPVLLQYCDLALSSHRTAPALAVWNSLASRNLIGLPSFRPGSAATISNPDFSRPLLSQAFDWNLASPPRVFVSREGDPATIRIAFSGKQPESCALLSQWVPLTPQRTYWFHTSYSTDGLPPDTGITWQMLDPITGGDLLSGAAKLTGATRQFTVRHDAQDGFPFTTPPGVSLARLVLNYQRLTGTVRIEGAVILHRVELSFAP
jgi:hypothetical protein